MMTKKKKGTAAKVDFLFKRLEGEDAETAALIKPLPGSIVPSQEFIERMRAHLLEVANKDGEARAA